MPPTGFLEASQLTLGPDGALEIIISRERPAGAANWLPMELESGTLVIRQTHLDRCAVDCVPFWAS